MPTQPVSSFIRGRAMKMAFEQDRLRTQIAQQRLKQMPQEFAMRQQAQRVDNLYKSALARSAMTPKPGRPVQVLGKDGKPMWATPGQAVGMPAVPREGTQVNVNLPGEPTKATVNQLQKTAENAIQGYTRLQALNRSWRPEFSTLGSKLKAAYFRAKSALGAELPPDDREWLTQFETFKTRAINNVNLYIREMTGAQMNEHEAKRIHAGVPNKDDDPVTFKAKMDTTMRDLALVSARARYAMQKGYTSLDEAPTLSSMRTIIDDRGKDIYQELLEAGVPQDEARARAKSLVAQEFGLLR